MGVDKEAVGLLREVYRSAIRAIGVLLPGFILGYLTLYSHHDYSLAYHLQIVGIFALLSLTATGLICLDRDIYVRHGRLALFALSMFTASSTAVRVLSLAHVLTPDERLLANTVVAIILSVIVHWFLWGHGIFKAFTRFVMETERTL